LRRRLGVMGALNMGHCIRRYSDVLSLNIVSFESFTWHELPALLGTPLVDEHIMEKKLANVQEAMYLLVASALLTVWCVVHFLYGWLFD
jgi:hypothetical protein